MSAASCDQTAVKADLLDRFAERSGVAVQARIHPAAAGLADARAALVPDIVRAALRNVERHARAQRVRFVLEPEEGHGGSTGVPERWRLELDDDGIGFDPLPPRPGHCGVTGVREQAREPGAELMLDSQPGQGCRLRLSFAA